MKWTFKWRKELDTGQYYVLLQRGFIKPEDREPSVEGFEFWLDAFRELSTSRPVGMDLAAIPFTAIAEYFRIYELWDFDEFIYIIRVMDVTYMELNRAEADRKTQGDKSANGNADTTNRNSRGHKGKPGHPGPRK